MGGGAEDLRVGYTSLGSGVSLTRNLAGIIAVSAVDTERRICCTPVFLFQKTVILISCFESTEFATSLEAKEGEIEKKTGSYCILL